MAFWKSLSDIHRFVLSVAGKNYNQTQIITYLAWCPPWHTLLTFIVSDIISYGSIIRYISFGILSGVLSGSKSSDILSVWNPFCLQFYLACCLALSLSGRVELGIGFGEGSRRGKEERRETSEEVREKGRDTQVGWILALVCGGPTFFKAAAE